MGRTPNSGATEGLGTMVEETSGGSDQRKRASKPKRRSGEATGKGVGTDRQPAADTNLGEDFMGQAGESPVEWLRRASLAAGLEIPQEPPPRPEPQKPTAPEKPALTVKQQVLAIAEDYPTACMSLLVRRTVPAPLEFAGFRRYREELLRQNGDPTDPVEVQMIEQLALMHFEILLLHAERAMSNDVENSLELLNGVCRMTAEYRRSALALKAYRPSI